MKGDPGADEHRGPPIHRVGEVDSHQQQQKQQPEGRNEGVPAGGGQVVEGVPGQHQEEHGQEGVPGREVQQEMQDDGMPGQEQIHIQREYEALPALHVTTLCFISSPHACVLTLKLYVIECTCYRCVSSAFFSVVDFPPCTHTIM